MLSLAVVVFLVTSSLLWVNSESSVHTCPFIRGQEFFLVPYSRNNRILPIPKSVRVSISLPPTNHKLQILYIGQKAQVGCLVPSRAASAPLFQECISNETLYRVSQPFPRADGAVHGKMSTRGHGPPFIWGPSLHLLLPMCTHPDPSYLTIP